MATVSSRPRRRSSEMLQVVVSCCGALGILVGFLPKVAAGTLGLALGGFIILATCLHVFSSVRAGKAISRALIEVAVFGLLAFGITFGCIWYFTVYLAAQPNLFQFRVGIPTPSPAR